MAGDFEDQGGAATMDPSPLYRFLASKLMTRMWSSSALVKRRKRAEAKRRREASACASPFWHFGGPRGVASVTSRGYL